MLVLENYPILMEQLETLIGDGEVPDNIEFYSGVMQAVLCGSFIMQTDPILVHEFVSEVIETDEIVELLLNFRSSKQGAMGALRSHINKIMHAEAASYINDMLGQVKNGM